VQSLASTVNEFPLTPTVTQESGGEGIRTPGTGFSQYNGLANSRFHTLLFGINRLRSDGMPYFGANDSCS